MRLLSWPIRIQVHVELPKFLQRLFDRSMQPIVVEAVRLRHLVDAEEGEPDLLIAVLEFNAQEANPDIPEHVDLNQLQSSLEESGTFFIWTCSCGAPSCAGFFDGVRVTHSNDETLWHDLDCRRKFIFKSKDLKYAFGRGIDDGQNILNDRPTLEVTPELNKPAYRRDR